MEQDIPIKSSQLEGKEKKETK